MATEVDFWRAIAADPGNLDTRLQYADWLEEDGRTILAEWFRIECELERLDQGAGEPTSNGKQEIDDTWREREERRQWLLQRKERLRRDVYIVFHEKMKCTTEPVAFETVGGAYVNLPVRVVVEGE